MKIINDILRHIWEKAYAYCKIVSISFTIFKNAYICKSIGMTMSEKNIYKFWDINKITNYVMQYEKQP